MQEALTAKAHVLKEFLALVGWDSASLAVCLQPCVAAGLMAVQAAAGQGEGRLNLTAHKEMLGMLPQR
ncbi:hypothetical protein HaLaN_07720 [Haematococcus lacustris]|uniref:Uncharacterized protein n=1 Tax=Haematococcus lacustris TaxID=44745 RepID=A0A699Z972_HAELA|nr:hypothetical protein HaLaN_07720 [Haematococcus lacustris]